MAETLPVAVSPATLPVPMPLHSVRLTGGPFLRAQELDGRYLLGLEPSRLLAPFFREAGLPVEAPAYGNWESQGLDGHTAGHYLSATSLMYASTGDERFLDRAKTMVEGMRRAQDAIGTGYVGGVPQGEALWTEVAAGGIRPDSFALEGRWVPWYNLHKTFAGLVEAYRSAGIDDALTVVTALGEWWVALAARLSDDDFERMLDTEFGGMNESFADLAALTGRVEFLAMAKRFSHRVILDPLVAGQDALTGLHANTQIPKVLGYQRVAEVGSAEPDFAVASRFFFDTVAERHSVTIGGHGVREHFHDPNDFTGMVEDREGPESCNTVNMIRLAGGLYASTGETRYLDFIETALVNHVLSAQHPEHGGFVYFTPLRPGHYRVYSEAENSFWCCVGTGMEVHARHAAYAYATRGDDLLVNLFMDSAVEWQGRRVTQLARTQDGVVTTLTIDAGPALHAAIGIRLPGWLSGEPSVRVNGVPVDAQTEDGYVVIRRDWFEDDVLEVHLLSTPRFEHLPDGSGWVSVVDGPVVYAAEVDGPPLDGLVAGAGRMSHIALGSLVPLVDAPLVEGDDADALIERAGDDRLVLHAVGQDVLLRPFAQVHDTRYTVYFPQGPDASTRLAELAERDRWQLGLDARTRDSVVLGEQQPESDHGFVGDGSESGRDGGVPWRRTETAMSVTLLDWIRLAKVLRVSWLDGDGDVDYEILVNGVSVARVTRPGADISPVVCDKEYALPAAVRSQDTERATVEFVARGGRTDRITEVRLLSE
ncbi:beta-L-arabinofuranosidase domain-containing protein [Leifsonia poae]|uniref:beta-L-arabinofuranosidase domain-containing protein n=1 Tax=Leifsonia poae TaxID=110933 RepID=UPI003D66E51B